jgi:hypothetical protein
VLVVISSRVKEAAVLSRLTPSALSMRFVMNQCIDEHKFLSIIIIVKSEGETFIHGETAFILTLFEESRAPKRWAVLEV